MPYRGAAPALTDLVAGVAQLKYDTIATSSALVAVGQLRAIAYAGTARSALMPAVPTVAELGFPGYEGVLWNGLLAPAGVPRPIIDRLVTAVVGAVRSPALAARLRRDGIEPVGSTPEVLAARIAKETTQWRELAKSVKIAID